MNKLRSCPICLHKKSELLYTQKFANHFNHRIVVCQLCGFVYVSNTPSQTYYDAYYKNQSKYEGTRQQEMHDAFTYKIFGNLLKKYVTKQAQILEVGCSTGKLLHFIKSKGYTHILGIEPAPACRAIAKKEFNVPVITTTIDTFSAHKKYDFIILSAVLEHLLDVRGTIMKVQELLNKNGLLYISVPDAAQFHKKFNEPFGEFSTEHINFFTHKSLTQLLSKFENVASKSDSHALLSLWKKTDTHAMCEYITMSEEKMRRIIKIISSLPKNTIVWGVGALTQRLLKDTSIKEKICKFVDSNQNVVGKKVEGIVVLSPSDLHKHSNTILVSSFGFKDEIVSEIKRRKLRNTIITF